MDPKLELIIGADLVPTESNYREFCEGRAEDLCGQEIMQRLLEADFRIFNLETPLVHTLCPIPKCGPNLSAPVCTIRGIRSLNPSLLTLANNHILDQGQEGILSTMETLQKYAIPFVGAGNSLQEASSPYILQKEGISVGIYACAEHEFSIASETSAGANPFDPLESYDHVSSLKKKCDYVIVLYHGGKEYYRYPSPNLQKYCRKFVEKGADLVICQHSHCIGCMENYQQGILVYGQGNFLFDHSEHECWQTSILLEVTFQGKGGKPQIQAIPIRKHQNTVRLAQGEDRLRILHDFDQRSDEIKNPEVVQQKYLEFSRNSLYQTLGRFQSVPGKWVLRFLRMFGRDGAEKWYWNHFLLRGQYLQMRNAMECEAWREMLICALSNWKK
ncbi:MAG: CapA family protein [Candidatus Merdivicinus sp.]|jgi:hypothetical protein